LEYQAGANGEPLGMVAGGSALLTAPIWLLRHKLGLPLPVPLKAYVCPDEVAFADKVDQIAGAGTYGTWRHPPTSVATEAGLILLGDHLSRMDPAGRAGIIAHELAHISQQSLAAGRRVRAPAWILEGHAEVVRVRVLDLAGYRTYDQSRAGILRSVGTSRRHPNLRVLERDVAWWGNSLPQSEAMYGQAFLAVEWLIELYGTEKLVEFLKLLRLDADPREHWGKVFPISYEYFIEEFSDRLKSLRVRDGPPSNLMHVGTSLNSPHWRRESYGR
jgi:hypothetical protein